MMLQLSLSLLAAAAAVIILVASAAATMSTTNQILRQAEILPLRCEDDVEDDRMWLSLSLICITELCR